MTPEHLRLIAADESESRHAFTAGVVIGIVVANKDPEHLGRVKVRFPALSDLNESAWAPIAAPMAGDQRGAFFLPEIDDQALVAFAHGDIRFPYILGFLWSAIDRPPADNADGKNNLRMLKSRSGHVVLMNDTKGAESIAIVDGSGKNSITVDTASNSITIAVQKDITLSAPHGKIKLIAQAIDIQSSGEAKMSGKTMALTASDDLTVKGQPINLN